MDTEILSYEADGLNLRSVLCRPAAPGRYPGVLVFPHAFGLGAHAASVAAQLAGYGMVALACDLHGDGRIEETLDGAMAGLAPMREQPARILARTGASLAVLAARPEVDATAIAAIGYCFGGTMAFELARSGAALRAAVGFHAGLAAMNGPARAGVLRARILACIGADDPAVPPDQRAAFEAEMRDAGADWQLHLYGGVVHSFTDPDADQRNIPHFARYDARAEARSWAAMRGVFAESGI